MHHWIVTLVDIAGSNSTKLYPTYLVMTNIQNINGYMMISECSIAPCNISWKRLTTPNGFPLTPQHSVVVYTENTEKQNIGAQHYVKGKCKLDTLRLNIPNTDAN